MDIVETSRRDVTFDEAAACSHEIEAIFQFGWVLVHTLADVHAVSGLVSPGLFGLLEHVV